MAVTTTLKLPEELKTRIASAAQSIGKAPHALMIDALTVQLTLLERRQAFIAFPPRQSERQASQVAQS